MFCLRHALPQGARVFRSEVRLIASTRILRHGSFEKQPPKNPEDVVNINVVDRKGQKHELKGKVGDNLLYLMHKFQEDNSDLMLEGACEASLACSTCHIIVDDAFYDKLPEPKEASYSNHHDKFIDRYFASDVWFCCFHSTYCALCWSSLFALVHGRHISTSSHRKQHKPSFQKVQKLLQDTYLKFRTS